MNGLLESQCTANEPQIDALQLFVSLRTISPAPNTVVSATLNNQCHKIWSMVHRLRVLDWQGEHASLSEPHENGICELDLSSLSKEQFT